MAWGDDLNGEWMLPQHQSFHPNLLVTAMPVGLHVSAHVFHKHDNSTCLQALTIIGRTIGDNDRNGGSWHVSLVYRYFIW